MSVKRRLGKSDTDFKGKYYDTMDFNGTLTNSINITVTSVYQEDDNGFNEIKVYSKHRKLTLSFYTHFQLSLRSIPGPSNDC